MLGSGFGIEDRESEREREREGEREREATVHEPLPEVQTVVAGEGGACSLPEVEEASGFRVWG